MVKKILNTANPLNHIISGHDAMFYPVSSVGGPEGLAISLGTSAMTILGNGLGMGILGAAVGGIMPDKKDENGNVTKEHTLKSGFVTGFNMGSRLTLAGVAAGGVHAGMQKASAIANFKVGQGA
jgi:hypothetical protein